MQETIMKQLKNVFQAPWCEDSSGLWYICKITYPVWGIANKIIGVVLADFLVHVDILIQNKPHLGTNVCMNYRKPEYSLKVCLSLVGILSGFRELLKNTMN